MTTPEGSQRSLKLLRDSGSLQSLIARDRLDPSDYTETGEYRLVQGIGATLEVPLVEVELSSKYGTGKYLFGLVDTLPAKSFHGLIGNDLDPPTVLHNEQPVSVVTRSQTRALRAVTSDTDKKGNETPDSDSTTAQPDSSHDLLDLSTLFDEKSLRVEEPVGSIKTKQDLVNLQKSDPNIAHLYNLVQPQTTNLNGEAAFFLDCDVLMRAWRSKTMPNIAGTECRQIVVPTGLRTALL